MPEKAGQASHSRWAGGLSGFSQQDGICRSRGRRPGGPAKLWFADSDPGGPVAASSPSASASGRESGLGPKPTGGHHSRAALGCDVPHEPVRTESPAEALPWMHPVREGLVGTWPGAEGSPILMGSDRPPFRHLPSEQGLPGPLHRPASPEGKPRPRGGTAMPGPGQLWPSHRVP